MKITTRDHDLLSSVVKTSGIRDPSRKLSNEIFPLFLMLGHQYVLLMKLLPSIAPYITVQVCKRKYLSQNLRTMPHSLLLVPLFHPSPLNMTIFSDAWMAFLQPVEIWFPMLSWQLCHFSLRSSPNLSGDTPAHGEEEARDLSIMRLWDSERCSVSRGSACRWYHVLSVHNLDKRSAF